MNNKNIHIKLQAGFTLMEMLVSLVISSIIFLGMCFIITETSRHHAYEDVKLDSKVFANYVLDDIESTIVKGSAISISAETYTGIDQITITLTDGSIVYGSHAEHGVAKDENKIYNYDNKYKNGQEKYKITQMICDKASNANEDTIIILERYNIHLNATTDILKSTYILMLEIALFDPGGDELESYTVDRYVFNPYIYSTKS